jgi:putative sterol carrier protein
VAQAEPGETPAVIFAAIDARLRVDPARAEGRSAAYAFDLSGETGGMFYIVLADGAGRAGKGAPDDPDVTLSMTAADFVAMTLGQLDGTIAFIEGKISMVGDIGLAVDLGAVFANNPQPPGNNG